MKKMIQVALLLFTLLTISFGNPAWAGDLEKGATIFQGNCASCHIGGKNAVNPAKTLQKADLEKYAMNSIDAIKTQVTNGKGAMPSFKGRLKPEDLENVALYVLSQAEKGWTK